MKKISKLKKFDDYLAKQFKDPEIKAEYDALEDGCDLFAYERAEAEFKKNLKTYTLQEVIDSYEE